MVLSLRPAESQAGSGGGKRAETMVGAWSGPGWGHCWVQAGLGEVSEIWTPVRAWSRALSGVLVEKLLCSRLGWVV